MSASRISSVFIGAVLLLCVQTTLFANGFAGLQKDARGFAAVTPGNRLAFPRDFGAHPDFRTEWWYVTANLQDDSGARYGVQWTLFRNASEPGAEREGWTNQNIWMGHAALTSANEHLFSETFARGGIGQAGVLAAPFRAWIDDWTFATQDVSPASGLSRMTISANGSEFRYELKLTTDKPLVLHGEEGFSRKSDAGQASYYYSQPFFTADGVLDVHGRQVKVSGRAWMDREWSSQQLASDQKGWDWFSLHFANGEQLMLYRFRSVTAHDYFAGTWVAADGRPQALERNDIALTPISQSKLAGRTLPTSWKVEVKSRALEIETTPLNLESWMATRFSYWEGPISFNGSHQGEGYLEMTGY
jgi:predicted secreted hydrolase